MSWMDIQAWIDVTTFVITSIFCSVAISTENEKRKEIFGSLFFVFFIILIAFGAFCLTQ